MKRVLEEIGLVGIVPVIAMDNADDALPLAQALIEGGLPCAEVTFRTSAASEAISRIANSFPNMLLGAGTVLAVDQVKAAAENGAKYIVSPGLNQKVVEYCVKNGIPVTPGVATPTEVEAALELGLDVVKFFPAEANGGVPYLRAISAPYKNMKFIPTGGIDESNILSYLMLPNVLACGGSWMVKAELINKKQFTDIKKLAEQAVRKVLGFELRHVGVNCTDATEAMNAASALSRLLGLPLNENGDSLSVGSRFEFLKTGFSSPRGYFAIGTTFLDRAVYYLDSIGLRLKKGTSVEKDRKLVAVDLDTEIAGYGLRLIQKE